MCKYDIKIWIDYEPKPGVIKWMLAPCGSVDRRNQVVLCTNCEYERANIVLTPDISTIQERRIV